MSAPSRRKERIVVAMSGGVDSSVVAGLLKRDDHEVIGITLQLYGAGREKRIYAVPPYTPVKSLDFDDHPFEVESWTECCALCGSRESFLDEMIVDDAGKRMFICSDTDWCERRR